MAEPGILAALDSSEKGILSERSEAALIAAGFVGLGLLFNAIVYLRLHGLVHDQSSQPDICIALAFFSLALLALRSLDMALFALPFASVLEVAPEIPHLPFMREFGSIVLIAILVRVLWAGAGAGMRPSLATLRRTFADPTLVALAAYVALSIVPLVGLAVAGQWFKAKVVVASLGFESLVLLLILTCSTVFSHCREQRMRLLMDSLFALSVTVTVLGTLELAIPFISSEQVSEFSYFGAYYYCRLKETFFGPDHLCAFLCLTIPIFVLVAANDRAWRRKLALACLVMVPILVIASSSRSVRIAMPVTFGLLALRREFRPLALGFGAYASAVTLATLPFRCVTDIVQTVFASSPTIIGGEYPLNEFLEDPARVELLKRFWEFLQLPGSFTIPDTAAYLARILFGVGAGLSAYRVFDLGTHTTYINVIIDKGIVGTALLAFAGLRTAAGLMRSWKLCEREEGLRSLALVAMLVPLIFVGGAFDVRLWLYAAFVAAIVIHEAEFLRSRQHAAIESSGERLVEAEA